MKKKNLAIIITLAISLYGYFQANPSFSKTQGEQQLSNSDSLSNAFKQRKSDIQVKGSGVVVHVLADDTKGSKHQKFLLKVSVNQTILIAHNIDLAPRINSIRKGDKIEFYGEYEWNEKGGVVHWTHLAPRGRHIDGWLKHNGKIYQ